jgi:hypothetical protein
MDQLIDLIVNGEYWTTREALRDKLRHRFMIYDTPTKMYLKFLLHIVFQIDNYTQLQLESIERYLTGMEEDAITGYLSITNTKDYERYVAMNRRFFVTLIDKDRADRYIICNTTVAQLIRHKLMYHNPCPYGEACYRQQNSVHTSEYHHPNATTRRIQKAHL